MGEEACGAPRRRPARQLRIRLLEPRPPQIHQNIPAGGEIGLEIGLK